MWALDCDIINKSSYLELVVQCSELRQKMISCRRESQSDTTWHRDHQSLVTFCQFLRVLHITDFNNNWTLSNLGNVFKTCGHKLLEVRQIFIKFKETVVVMWPDHHLENISYYALLRTALQTRGPLCGTCWYSHVDPEKTELYATDHLSSGRSAVTFTSILKVTLCHNQRWYGQYNQPQTCHNGSKQSTSTVDSTHFSQLSRPHCLPVRTSHNIIIVFGVSIMLPMSNFFSLSECQISQWDKQSEGLLSFSPM